MNLSVQSLIYSGTMMGLLILLLSTSLRFQSFEAGIIRIGQSNTPLKLVFIQALRSRAKRFKAALASLYLALVGLALAGAIVLVIGETELQLTQLSEALMVFAVASGLYALMQLLQESRQSARLLLDQIDTMKASTSRDVSLTDWVEDEITPRH